MSYARKPLWLNISTKKRAKAAEASVGKNIFWSMISRRRLSKREVRAVVAAFGERALNAITVSPTFIDPSLLFSKFNYWNALQNLASRPDLTGDYIHTLLSYLSAKDAACDSETIGKLIQHKNFPISAMGLICANQRCWDAILRYSPSIPQDFQEAIFSSVNCRLKIKLLKHQECLPKFFTEEIVSKIEDQVGAAEVIGMGLFSQEILHNFLYHQSHVLSAAAANRISETLDYLEIRRYAKHVFGSSAKYYTKLISHYIQTGSAFGSIVTVAEMIRAVPTSKEFCRQIYSIAVDENLEILSALSEISINFRDFKFFGDFLSRLSPARRQRLLQNAFAKKQINVELLKQIAEAENLLSLYASQRNGAEIRGYQKIPDLDRMATHIIREHTKLSHPTKPLKAARSRLARRLNNKKLGEEIVLIVLKNTLDLLLVGIELRNCLTKLRPEAASESPSVYVTANENGSIVGLAEISPAGHIVQFRGRYNSRIADKLRYALHNIIIQRPPLVSIGAVGDEII